MARSGGEREVGRGLVAEQLLCSNLLVFWARGCLSGRSDFERTSVVPDHGPVALAIDAVAEHAEVDAAIGSDWNGRDDGR
jgi:hypothetical protein